jgi:membrane-bound lytic murein transglycosylase B
MSRHAASPPVARAVRLGLGSLLVLGTLATGLAAPAAAQDDEVLPPLSAELIEERLDPRMRRIVVDSGPIREAESAYERGLFEVAEAGRRIRSLEAELETITGERSTRAAELDVARAELGRIAVELADTESALRAAVLDTYMNGAGASDRILATVEPAEASRAASADELAASSSELLLDRRTVLRQDRTRVRSTITSTERRLAELANRIVSTRAQLQQARTAGFALALSIPTLEEAYRAARLTATVRGIDVPLLALDAYVRSADLMAGERPSCGVSWWHLAGIGRVESNHGRFQGRALRSDGTVDNPIVGVALDGETVLGDGSSVARIGDTDGGLLDGDPVFDRAVGPMQFIPSTWARWNADGNADGVSDPNNIYDAALAAARYLCAVSGDLRSEEGTRRALIGYNRSEAYVQRVYDLANGYSTYPIPR